MSVLKTKEARKHERIKLPERTFVIVSPGTDREWKVQAIDISQGGMAFIYHGSREDLDKSGVLKILAKNADLDPVHFETVRDEPAPGRSGTSLPLRRRGVKFKWMGVMKPADLKVFIQNCTC